MHTPIPQLPKIALILSLLGFSLNGAFLKSAKAGIAEPSPLPAPAQVEPIAAASENPSLLEDDESGVTLELVIPTYEITRRNVDGISCDLMEVPDFSQTQTPGHPQTPIKTALVGIPESANPSLTVLEADQAVVEGQFSLCPAPRPIVEFPMEAEIRYLGEQSVKDPTAYEQDSFLPEIPAEISSLAMIRSQRVAQITFQPFQYNPTSGKVQYFQRLRIRVSFNLPKHFAIPQPPQNDEGAYEGLLHEGLVNGSSAMAFRAAQPANIASIANNSSPEGQTWIKLMTNQNGMTAVTYDELAAAGVNLNELIPSTVQVFNQGVEIAILVTGDQDGSFDPGDQILFYGEGLDTKYTDTNVYWLTWNQSTGRRMGDLNVSEDGGQPSEGFLFTQHVEKNVFYRPATPDSRGDHWYWSYINANGGTASGSFPFTATHVDHNTSLTARLRGSFFSDMAMPKHHAKVYVNGYFVAEGYWTPLKQFDFEATFPMSFLVEGENTIRVDLLCDGLIAFNRAFINWFEVDYWKTYTTDDNQLIFSGELEGTYTYNIAGFSAPTVDLYDITDPNSPVRMSGASIEQTGDAYWIKFQTSTSEAHTYQALIPDQYLSPTAFILDQPSDLRSPSNRADYLLISHADFISAVQPLADWRRSQDMRVQLIDVQDIYDEFNGGVFSPDAIRDFIAYAYETWERPAPQYVLLVGDGHYDPRNYLGTNNPIYIPAYLQQVDAYLGETASDNRYVTVSGTDNLPDLMIGRLPVTTSAEAAAIVAKLIAYEQTPMDVDWNENVLFVTDNPDAGGDFYHYSDMVANSYVPAGYTASKVYYGSTHTTTANARAAILNSINQGDLVVNYVGHGNVNYWAAENLFQNSSVYSLTNSGKLPFFSMIACLTGYFHYPNIGGVDYTSIAEAIVKAPGRGGIASWASTGMGVMAGQDYLNRGLFHAIFYEGQNTIGAAAQQAKLYLYSQSSFYPDLLDTYTLFGDPALRLNVRPSDLSIHITADPVGSLYNGTPITYTLSYENIGFATATQIQIDHPLPDTIGDIEVIFSDPDTTQVQGSKFSWIIDELVPGECGTIIVRGIINYKGSGEISSHATIYSPIADLNTENNYAGPIQRLILAPTAVEVISVEGTRLPDQVILEWETANEMKIVGFHIERKMAEETEWTRLNQSLILSRSFGTPVGNVYQYIDLDIPADFTFQYRVVVIEEDAVLYYEVMPLSYFIQMYLPIVSH